MSYNLPEMWTQEVEFLRKITHILKFYILWICLLNMRINKNIPKHMDFRTYHFERNFWRKYANKD